MDRIYVHTNTEDWQARILQKWTFGWRFDIFRARTNKRNRDLDMSDIKPSAAGFERWRLAEKEQERELIARKLHAGFECLTAASFAVELAKEAGEQQSELVSRASRLLTEAIELLRGVTNDKKDATRRRRSAPKSVSVKKTVNP
jgi:hypothetical protein